MCFLMKCALRIIIYADILFLFLATYCGVNYYTRNVHPVISGQIYRSAQLNENELIKYTQKYHIKTIINLRGVYQNKSWYQTESLFAKNHALDYVTIHFTSTGLPQKDQLKKLVAILETAKKPLLLHCEGGADRTGMAAAISIILFKKMSSIAEIKMQDSWRYNVLSSHSIGHQVLPNYFDFLKKNHRSSSETAFYEWLDSPEKMTLHYGHFFVF